MHSNRRTFLKTAALLSGVAYTSTNVSAQEKNQETLPQGSRSVDPAKRLHVAVNQFTCNNYYSRDGKKFMESLAELKSSGVDGIEPTISTVADAEAMGKRLRDAGLEMRSFYTGPNFFKDDETSATEQKRIVDTAKKAFEFGSRFVVCNSAAKSGKSDEEIYRQTAEYEKLGRSLADLGMKLAMHYHTTEWEFGGREFLHLMSNTAPELVGFCFDTHWSYRACGNSMASVLAHLHLFANRTYEFHFRQSIDHVWSEAFGEGDIDHQGIVDYFKKNFPDRMPHIVLEQAAEKGTPKTLTAPEVFQKSTDFIRKMFG